MNNFDLVIIGGGAAGIMAAISAKRSNPELSVCIIDRTFALGRKILVCGAGRCNITNIHLNEEVDSRYYGASKSFISSIFSHFSYSGL
jgi:predicted flavoprotein YhiN